MRKKQLLATGAAIAAAAAAVFGLSEGKMGPPLSLVALVGILQI